MKKTTIYDCSIIYLPKIGDRSGHITAVNNRQELPFDVQRVFYIYDIPAGESRGAHAHKECHQFLIALTGAFEVLVDDGSVQKSFSLNRPNVGLHIPPGIWASEMNFSGGSICMVLTSEKYNEVDYIRDYNEYLRFAK